MGKLCVVVQIRAAERRNIIVMTNASEVPALVVTNSRALVGLKASS